MLSGATFSAAAMAGAAVFRIVVSSDSMKNATATSHGRRRLLLASMEGAGAGFGMAARRSAASLAKSGWSSVLLDTRDSKLLEEQGRAVARLGKLKLTPHRGFCGIS